MNLFNIFNDYHSRLSEDWMPVLESKPGNTSIIRTQDCYNYSSPLMKKIMDAVIPTASNGTVPSELMGTLNDANKIEVSVKGEAIFKQISDLIKTADEEVLLQTFVWDKRIPGVKLLNEALQEVAKRKQEQKFPKPLRVYIMIDERGRIANLGFNGKAGKKWACTAESLGLFSAPGLVDVYPATFHHNSFRGNHAKTVVVDSKAMIITGANFQASNYGHVPAHDAALLFRGLVAISARHDFIETWNSPNRQEESPSFPLVQETKLLDVQPDPNARMIPVLFVSRRAQPLPNSNSYNNPLVQTFLSAIENACHLVQIATPNINDPKLIDALVAFINNRGGVVELLLGKGFNDAREVKPGLGGTNQNTVNTLFRRIDDELSQNLKIRWFSLDGKSPVQANVAGACHLKFTAIDGQVSILGNANWDKISLQTLHECNGVIDDMNTTKNLTDTVFNPVFKQSVEAKPSDSIKEIALEFMGYRGSQEKLAETYQLAIHKVVDQGSGYRTLHFIPPHGWSFKPGQYLEIRSGNLISETFKGPAVLAIASGTNDQDIQVTARSSMKPWHPNRALHRGEGRQLEITGPIGTSFPMELVQPTTDLLLIGGGSGLTALRSVMHSLPSKNCAKLYYSAKTASDVLYQDEVKEWVNGGHHISLTQEIVEGYKQGRIIDVLKNRKVRSDTLAFICGPVEMVKAVVKELIDKGLDKKQIYASLPVSAKEGGPVFRADHPRLL